MDHCDVTHFLCDLVNRYFGGLGLYGPYHTMADARHGTKHRQNVVYWVEVINNGVRCYYVGETKRSFGKRYASASNMRSGLKKTGIEFRTPKWPTRIWIMPVYRCADRRVDERVACELRKEIARRGLQTVMVVCNIRGCKA